MKFKTLNGKEVSCELSSVKYPIRTRENSRSNAQFHLGQQLLTFYGPAIPVLEEFTIPDCKLSLDFFVPLFKIAFEYQGEQHFAFNSLFHFSKEDFIRQQKRDAEKRQWCDLNGIILVEIVDPLISIKDLNQLILEAHNGKPIG